MRRTGSSERETGISRRRFLQHASVALGAAAVAALPGAALPGAALSRASWALPQRASQIGPIDVTAAPFGAKGDGTTNDRAAFQAAIDAAIAAGRPLFVPRPAKFYRIILEPNHDRLLVNGNLTIVGAGRTSTLLRFTVQGAGTGKYYAGFFIVGGSAFQMADLRLEEDLHQPVEQFEFMGLFFESGARDHACLIENVDIEGFTHCIYTPSSGVDGGRGELFLALRDCDLHPWWQYGIAFWTVPEGHKRLHLYDCTLHDNQFSHLVYCHPHNSVHVENCRFDGATSWAFQFQGSEVAGDPEYQRFVGCWFGPRNSRGIITQDRAEVATTVEVRNCIFEGRPAIQIRSDVVIDNCYFTTSRDPGKTEPFIGAYSNSPWKATVRNCIFAPKIGLLPQVDLRLEDIDVTVENCQFYHQGSGTIMNLGVGAASRYRVANCTFYNRPDNGSQAVSLEVDNGQALVEDCLFIGRATGDRGAVVLRSTDTGPAADARLQLDRCTFQAVSGGSVFYALGTGANSWSGKLSGAGNRFERLQNEKPLLMLEPSAPFFARLTPVAGQAPAALSAGPALVLSGNYDTYGVSGPADVSAIHWVTADGLSDALFSGVVTLVAGPPFALVTGGNVTLAGGATRRDVAAGATVRLSYDPQGAVWTEAA
ncbi:right-handed parallel beta-helix repeat-containing protein [Promineifilum sp.]|uniref:right-handed parallel beta-helix repeat-containing protein n=1 Tax=Promineifilum sp. TaxID=2664178 RepID=UPI0035B1D7A2